MTTEHVPSFHASALVETDDIGAGTRVWAFAHILSGAVIGQDCKIGDHVFIEGGARLGDRVTVKNNSMIWHGVHIGDDVFIGPGVVFTNDPTPRVRYQTTAEDWIETTVDSGASIGANATILCGIRIGKYALVGAGSVLTSDVRHHALMFGNPAEQQGWVCDCGAKLTGDLTCPQCGRRYKESEAGLTSVGDSR